MTDEEEIKVIVEAGHRAMVQACNKARNDIGQDWAERVRETYQGSVYANDIIPIKSAADMNPSELSIVMARAVEALEVWAGNCVFFKKPAVFDEAVDVSLSFKERSGMREGWNDISRMKSRLLVFGYKAAKAAYLELHPELAQDIKR